MLLGQKISDRVAEMRNAAQGHRPALGVPSSRLDRPRRSRNQDPRAARDHRLGEADLHQGRRRAPLLRRRARGEGRRRRRRARRHAGRHGRDAGSVHRACRPADARLHSSGGAGAAGSRHAPQGAADRLGRHPQRCRRAPRRWRSAPTPSRSASAALVALGDNDPRCEAEYHKLGTTAGAYDDWHEGSDPAGITTQDPELAQRLDPVRAGRRLANYLKVMTLEAADHRARLRPQPRPQPRAGGSVRAHHRGGRHGARSARWHELDSRTSDRAVF